MPARDVYESLSRVRRPLQDRSRQAQAVALDVFEEMLRELPLHKVTVQHVADRAGLSITSVYARFDGKKALVLAVHERVIQDGLRRVQQVLTDASGEGRSVEATVASLMSELVAFSADHRHVFVAVLSAADDETNERAASFVRETSAAVAAHVVPRLTIDSSETERVERVDGDVDHAWRAVVAVVQQGWMLGTGEPARHPLTPDALASRLAAQFLAMVGMPPAV